MARKNYYGVWYPTESFHVGQRFFFFNSLYNATSNINSANKKSGADLAQEVAGSLSKGKIFNPKNKDEEGLKIIQSILDFLQRTIEYERNQELIFFHQKLSEMPKELQVEFKPFFESKEDKFDYIKFIELINILETGRDGYKKLLTYEKERLTEINKAINNFLSLSKEEQKVTKNIKNEAGEIIDTQQIDQGFYSNFRNYLYKHNNKINNTYTFSNNIQRFIIDAVTDLWNSPEWNDILQEYIGNRIGQRLDAKNITQYLTITLMNQVMPKIKLMILDKDFQDKSFKNIVTKSTLTPIIKNAVIDTLKSIPSSINSEESASDFFDKIIKGIEDMQEGNLSNDEKRFLKVVDPVYTTTNNKKEKILHLADELKNTIITDLKINKGKTVGKNASDEAIINAFLREYPPENFDITIASPEEKVEILNKYANNSRPFLNFRIAGKDNVISEAFAIGNIHKVAKDVLNQIHLASGYQKADVFGIENQELGQIIMTLNESGLNNLASQMAKDVSNSFFQAIEIQPQPLSNETKNFIEQKYRQAHGFGATEFSIGAETKRRVVNLQKLCNEEKKRLEDNGVTADLIDKILKDIKNTVRISTTVKGYNKYNNQQGFHGGSLGGSVETQLKNIYKMYEYGGVDLPDINWMTFAVYNSGNNMIGSENKTPIEHILSAVAGMLLFDDAGEQALYIKSQIEGKQFIPPGGSRFLHLYYLNDFYFPSSYILQLTYNGLVEAYNMVQEFSFYQNADTGNTSGNIKGATVTIENNVIEPSSSYNLGWGDFFEGNKDGVSINIVFLAGLLDIIKILNSKLGQ